MAFSSSATVARSAVADINITPLVDVLLVLLVIFMLSIPIIERPFDLSLQPSIDPKPASIEPLELRINADGQFVYAGQIWDSGTLQGLLSVESARSPQPPLHLFADAEAPYERVTEALTLASNSGISQVGMP